jgi:uncharacterized FlaG/YvyC family protein
MDVPVVGTAAAVPQQAPPAGPLPADAPADRQGAGPVSQQQSGPLSRIVAKLLSSGDPQQASVDVSYRVEHDPNIIVTVFTDPTTGQVIAQIPPEVLLQFAQFFDKHSGVTLDRSA